MEIVNGSCMYKSETRKGPALETAIWKPASYRWHLKPLSWKAPLKWSLAGEGEGRPQE